MIAGALIIMFSCTKENNESVIKNEANDCQSCKAGIELANKINKFKERLAYARENVYKDGDEMTKEEAIENMELLINASHGFPGEEYKQITIDTVEFTLPLNPQGMVSATDVATSYENMQLQVKDVFDNVDYQEKHIVSVILNEGDGNVVQVITTTGDKEPDPGNGPFQDCWWYGEDMGMCDGTYAGERDGGDEIADELFENRPSIVCPEGYHVVIGIDYSNEFTGNDTQSSGYIFYMEKSYNSSFTDPEKQLIAYEMNYWYNKEYEFLFSILPVYENKPSNWLMASIKIDGNEHYNYPVKRWINHKNYISYGLAYCVQDEVLAPPFNP